MCTRRPLAHTLGFLVLSFSKVAVVGIDKSFAVEVGSSSSMLHKSNLLEFIFQSSLHGYKGVAVHLIAVGKEEGGEDAQAQLVVPDTSCGEGMTKVTSSNMSATFCPGYCCGLRLSNLHFIVLKHLSELLCRALMTCIQMIGRQKSSGRQSSMYFLKDMSRLSSRV